MLRCFCLFLLSVRRWRMERHKSRSFRNGYMPCHRFGVGSPTCADQLTTPFFYLGSIHQTITSQKPMCAAWNAECVPVAHTVESDRLIPTGTQNVILARVSDMWIAEGDEHRDAERDVRLASLMQVLSGVMIEKLSRMSRELANRYGTQFLDDFNSAIRDSSSEELAFLDNMNRGSLGDNLKDWIAVHENSPYPIIFQTGGDIYNYIRCIPGEFGPPTHVNEAFKTTFGWMDTPPPIPFLCGRQKLIRVMGACIESILTEEAFEFSDRIVVFALQSCCVLCSCGVFCDTSAEVIIVRGPFGCPVLYIVRFCPHVDYMY